MGDPDALPVINIHGKEIYMNVLCSVMLAEFCVNRGSPWLWQWQQWQYDITIHEKGGTRGTDYGSALKCLNNPLLIVNEHERLGFRLVNLIFSKYSNSDFHGPRVVKILFNNLSRLHHITFSRYFLSFLTKLN